MSLISNPKRNDDVSVRQAIARLGSSKLGPTSTPTFAGVTTTTLTISGLTADSLIYPVNGLLTSLGVAANGQLPIGSTGTTPVLATLTATANQVNIANAAGSITLSTPQDIHTDATPEFNDVILGDWQYSTPTYDSVHDWMNTTQSAGLISGGVISDATGGNINVTAGTGFAKSADTEIATTLFVDFAARNGIAIAQDTKYNIYVDYDASPAINITSNPSVDVDHTTKFSIGSVFYDGTTMHILNGAGTRVYNLARRTHYRARKLREFERATGLMTGDESTRYFSITNGLIFAGLNEVNITGIDTSDPAADTFASWYYDGDLGGGADWVKTTGVRQLDNVQYNAVGTGVVNLGTNRYGVHWVFMDVDNHCNVVYGQGNYTLAQAQNAALPATLPDLVNDFAILISKVIVQEGAAEIIEIETAFETTFLAVTANNHNELAGLQGGTADEYYHMAASEHTLGAAIMSLTPTDGNFIVGNGSTWIAESGNTARTSLGLGTGDSPTFTNCSLGTGELTCGSINRAAGTLALEIGGIPQISITSTSVTFAGAVSITGVVTHTDNIIIPNNGWVGSVTTNQAIQIETDGDIVIPNMLAVTGDAQVTGNILLMTENGGIGYSDNSPMLVFNNANNLITVTGNIVVADDATIGLSDGVPQLLFDDTQGEVVVGGDLVVNAGSLKSGVDDTTRGYLYVYGGATGFGGSLYLHVAADSDTVINSYNIMPHEDDLRIGTDVDGDIITITAGSAVAVTTTLNVTGTITASNYTAANLLTACATNAGALDFSAASKTLTVEDNAVVSQDYSSDASPQFTGIELGHVSDTTITRASAGNLNIEGNLVYRASGTDVPIGDGGTGQSTAQAAIDALTAVGAATNEHVLTKDTATGNAVFKAAAGGGAHTHDGDTLQLDGVNSDGGAFSFTTSGAVTFSQSLISIGLTVTNAAVIVSNSAVFQPNVDSATFFQVKDQDGNVFLTGDSTNNKTISDIFDATDENNALQIDGTTILRTGTAGNCNMFLGEGAFSSSEGTYNVGIGFEAGKNNDDSGGLGKYNVYIGANAGKGGVGGSTGHQNFGVGASALRNVTSGHHNLGLGVSALARVTGGDYNVAIGREAGAHITNTNYGVFIGDRAGYTATEASNTIIGSRAGYAMTTGTQNTYIGSQVGYVTNGGDYNTCIGVSSAEKLTSGSSNVFIGLRSGYRQTTNSNLLIIDNQDRTSAVLELTNSLIYGVFDATPASQSLRFNLGNLYFGNPTHSNVDGGGAIVQSFIREDGAGTASTAATITVSHDGAGANDTKGKWIVAVNNGTVLTQALEIGSDLLATFAGSITLSTNNSYIGFTNPRLTFNDTSDRVEVTGALELDTRLYILERADDAGAQTRAGYGQLWIKNTTPNELWFTDDAGGDVQLGAAGADEKVKIDAAATAGYLGTASNDGVLQTAAPFIYADGGNFITLSLDAGLTDLAAVAMVADRFYYTSADNTHVAGTVTTAGRAILDDANAAAQCTTLGLGTGDTPTFTGLIVNGNVGITADTDIIQLASTKATINSFLFEDEQAAATTDVAGYGQWWVKSDVPCTPQFTDDAGNDIPLSGYVARGDPADWDFTQTDLTMDSAYHDLDLSSIVPAGAFMVHLRVVYKDNTVGAWIQFIDKDHSNGYNAFTRGVLVADQKHYTSDTVGCSSARVIQYKVSEAFTEIDIVVRGWEMA